MGAGYHLLLSKIDLVILLLWQLVTEIGPSLIHRKNSLASSLFLAKVAGL